MKYDDALEIGHRRAQEAAEVVRRRTGVQAMAVCALKPGSVAGHGRPVGRLSWKEIARDDGFRSGGRYHLLIVDNEGTAKACSRESLSLEEVLRLAERLPLPVAAPGWGELWKALHGKSIQAKAGEPVVHVEP